MDGLGYILFFEKTASLFDYLPASALVVTIGDTQAKANEFWHEITSRYEQGRYDTSRPLLAAQTRTLPKIGWWVSFR